MYIREHLYSTFFKSRAGKGGMWKLGVFIEEIRMMRYKTYAILFDMSGRRVNVLQIRKKWNRKYGQLYSPLENHITLTQ